MDKKNLWTGFRRCMIFGVIVTALFWFGYPHWSGNEIPSLDQINLFGQSIDLPIQISRLTDIIAVPILLWLVVLCVSSSNGLTIGLVAGAFASVIGLVGGFQGDLGQFIGITLTILFITLFITLIICAADFGLSGWTFTKLCMGFSIGLSISFACYPFVFVLLAAIGFAAIFAVIISVILGSGLLIYFVVISIGWGAKYLSGR